MASLFKPKRVWYARVSMWNPITKKQKQLKISLKTESKGEARIRIARVNKIEADIKNGTIKNLEDFLPWLDKCNVPKVLSYPLHIAIEDYLAYLKHNGRKNTTVNRAQYCLNNLMTVLGKGQSTYDINNDSIEHFKAYYKNKLSDNGININLTRIKAFINWCYEVKEILEKKPRVRFVKVSKKIPSYLTQSNLIELHSLQWLHSHYKDVFNMYLQTGMRLREPFYGKIDGEWLLIEPEDTKTGYGREVFLLPHHTEIILTMQSKMYERTSTFKTFTDHYSKIFKKAMKEIGRPNLHFHNLRDTFAVMRYLETRDIYQVSKELGHTTVKVTEQYAMFSIRKLENDFPKLAGQYVGRIRPQIGIMSTNRMSTLQGNTTFVEEGRA